MRAAEKKWICLFGVIFVLALVAAYAVNHIHQDNRIAEVFLHNKLVKTIDLDRVEQPYTFRLDTGNGGYNVLKVSPGKIEVVEANCRDQICVNQGAIHDGVKPIVCLPHELVIKINGEKTVVSHAEEHSHDHSQPDIVTR